MSSELPDAIGDLEREIDRMDDELTHVALDVGRRSLAGLHREDRFARSFLAGEMDGASHDPVRVGLCGEHSANARRLYLAGFALGWDSHRIRRAS
jgi:hypothetical protein